MKKRPRSAGLIVLWFAAAASLIVLRRPDCVLNAQFWAEDGRFFFADAYNDGALTAIFTPYNGYLHIVPRFAAGVATLFPFALAPLVMNAVAIVIQALPAVVLASRRMESVFPDPKVRIALALLYLVGPGVAGEINASVTNSQWHLAVLSWCLIVAPAPQRTWRVAADAVALALTALSGPFAILLLPIAFIASWSRERRVLTLGSGVLLVGAAIQLAVLSSGSRPRIELGPSLDLLGSILTCQVLAGALLGAPACAALGEPPPRVELAIVIAGIAIATYAMAKAPSAVRLFIIFATLVLVASIVSPIGSWTDLAGPGNGARYWFIPAYAVAMVTVWLWSEAPIARRVAGYAIMCVLAVGIGLNWRQLPLEDMRFEDDARWFEGLPSGTVATIRINPPLPPWNMVLKKHER